MQMIGIFTTVEETKVSQFQDYKVNPFQSGTTQSQISIIPLKCESMPVNLSSMEQTAKLQMTTQQQDKFEQPFPFVSDTLPQEFSSQSKLFSRSSPKLDQLVDNISPVTDFPFMESSRYPSKEKSMATIKKKGSAKQRKKKAELNFMAEMSTKRPRSNLSSVSKDSNKLYKDY